MENRVMKKLEFVDRRDIKTCENLEYLDFANDICLLS